MTIESLYITQSDLITHKHRHNQWLGTGTHKLSHYTYIYHNRCHQVSVLYQYMLMLYRARVEGGQVHFRRSALLQWPRRLCRRRYSRQQPECLWSHGDSRLLPEQGTEAANLSHRVHWRWEATLQQGHGKR